MWRARDLDFGRDVALTVKRSARASDPAARARFERELAITARLRHPGVVPVHDRGEIEGRLGCTMELPAPNRPPL